MSSEETLKEKLPLITSILLENGIDVGQYSVSTYSLSTEGEFGCIVSPTTGNSYLFTIQVQESLTSAGISFKIN